jgi:predicted esterase
VLRAVLSATLISSTNLSAQQEIPDILEPQVTFLSSAPTIDGVLDNDLVRLLPLREFDFTHVGDGYPALEVGAESPGIPASYRLGYGTGFFYVYVEALADKLTFRDRAYQNGDGFSMVLAVPRPDNAPTDEFYVLSCSAVNDRRMEWTRSVFWYYNVDHIFVPTSDETRLEFHEGDGKISFELYLPWHDVHPYHPWLSDGIGFNLRFVKAIEDGGRERYIVAPYSVGAENSNRQYVRLDFETPQLEGDASQTFALLQPNTIGAGDTLRAMVATLSAQPFTQDLRVGLRSGEGELVKVHRLRMEHEAGPTVTELTLDTRGIPPGGYRVEWQSRTNGARAEKGLTVLPPVDLNELGDRLTQVRGRLSEGSHSTIEFYLQEVDRQLEALRPYETAAAQRLRLVQIADHIDRAGRDEDAIAERREFVRRAYRSILDSTLQPYVVWVPPDFDPEKQYPLLVFLHGSASDETDILGAQRLIPEGFIALGPKGRGPSNAWSWDHAQEDVAESIEAVIANYPIDTDRIVLSGFSMGGYGVYRTYYETPDKFTALVVLSGAPNIANRYADTGTFPNFNEERYLEVFKGIPIFVFHGRRDLNVSFGATAALVEKLKAVGASVEFHVEDDKGHESPGATTVEALDRWLGRVLGLGGAEMSPLP